jgi:hypothetical protein
VAQGRDFLGFLFTALKGRSSTEHSRGRLVPQERTQKQKEDKSKNPQFGRRKPLLSWFIRAIK